MNENHYIQTTEETNIIAARIIERFAGDPDSTMMNLQANGIVFGKIIPKPIEDTVGIKPAPEVTETEQPKEWIEQQGQERRAWALNAAIEAAPHVDFTSVVEMAKIFEKYVIGEGDINDQIATDLYYLILGEMIEERDGSEEVKPTEDFLADALDRMAKNGVRLKDGPVLEIGS